MNYEIIANAERLNAFIEFLPDLTENEIYYLTLLSRNKYTEKKINTKTVPLKRFTSTKKHMLQSIRQLECELGSYTKDGMPVEPTSLALYITTNPRCLKKATYSLLVEVANNLKNNSTTFNPMSDVLTCINRSKSRAIFVTFDIDNKDNFEDKIEFICKTVGPDAVVVIETRGGYHVLIKPAHVFSDHKNWYQIIDYYLSDKGADQIGDLLSPVPGTFQGDFEVQFELKYTI